MRPADICLSIRFFRNREPGAFGSAEAAHALVEALRPTRIEWSYVRDAEAIARFKQTATVFVAALNTIQPSGHAQNFTGEPVIAPWMTRFGTPTTRSTYICQNNPDDRRSRADQAVALIADGTADSFQFDDWYGNAQILEFGQPCFCDHCCREFAVELGLDLHYRDYLRGRGFTHHEQILAAAKTGDVPLWDDYRRFQQRTVTRFFRQLHTVMRQALSRPPSLSVNGSVLNFGGRIDTVLPFVDYLHGETHNYTPTGLLRLAEASRQMKLPQIVSFFPPVAVDNYDDPAFVAGVKQAIALCYCLGLLPLFPYDVYTGNDPRTGAIKPRWFGTFAQYGETYDTVRRHPEWFDDYAWESCEIADDGAATVTAHHRQEAARKLIHTVEPDGRWQTHT